MYELLYAEGDYYPVSPFNQANILTSLYDYFVIPTSKYKASFAEKYGIERLGLFGSGAPEGQDVSIFVQ